MNYVVLNDNEYYKNIQLSRFKEVNLDGRTRVDGIFGTITPEILEESSSDGGDRDSIFREKWFSRNCGIIFMVMQCPKNLLYDDSGELLERSFRMFCKKNLFIEVWGIRIQNTKNTYRYFIIGYNKKLGFKMLTKEGFLEKKEEEIIPFLCETIEEKIL